MKAYVVPSAGEAPAILDVDIPEPEPGEVRVRVSAASVNGFDLAVAAGYMAGYFEHRYPLVLGREFAGVVDALGEGVEGVVIGDRVIGVVSKPHLQEGAFAEYTTAIVESGVALAPDSLSDAAAASLAHTGSTALVILDTLGDIAGKTLLIVGATGGVGTLLVQLTAAAGATVIATGRTDEGRALLRELGAAHAVDYADLEEEVRAIAPEGVDAAVHLIGDVGQVGSLVRDGGRLVSPVAYAFEGPDAERIRFATIAGYSTGDGLRKLADLVDQGALRVIVDREKSLDDTEAAFAEYAADHKIGNIVVIVGG
ncbi:NADP-dependent oxidoreductase [Microbacterium deminutum]|uniref:NADP-dependent oxidoreductase n=1 Tax=Microbacterium deminutum TaxID=344164 RepID=A0ABN2QD44_9MICO